MSSRPVRQLPPNPIPASQSGNLIIIIASVICFVAFVVGVGLNGNYFADSTGLSAILTTSIVPEPSTLAIMLVGIGLGCCRRGPLAATLSRKIKMPRSGI